MDITILDSDFQTVVVLDAYKSFIWTDRYNEVGDFEIITSPHIYKYIFPDFYVKIPLSDRLMIIETIEDREDPETGPELTISGSSSESLLKRRIVWDLLQRDFEFQEGIKYLIDTNIIFPANPDREIPNFGFDWYDELTTDLAVSWDLHGETLYEIIQNECTSYGIGFKVSYIDGSFTFQLYLGDDHSMDQTDLPVIMFSPRLDNIANSTYYESTEDYKNVIHVVGDITGQVAGGEEDTQVVYDFGNAKGLSRREGYLSESVSRSPLYNAEYQVYQSGLIEYINSNKKTMFEGEITQTSSYVYGIDYHIGDIVQVENEEGQSNRSRVTEVIISGDGDGTSIVPTFEAIE